MKKILFIIGSLEGGGAEKVLITVLNNFDFHNFKVDLLILRPIGVHLNAIPKQVSLIKYYSNSNSILKTIEARIFKYFKTDFFEILRTRLKVRKKYSTIISFLEGSPLRIHSYVVKRADVNITWVHTDLFNNYNTRNLWINSLDESNAYKQMSKIIFVSYEAKYQFGKRFKNNVEKHVLYNPIDRKHIQKYPDLIKIHKLNFTICCIGRLEEVKSFDRVLRLAKRLKNDNYSIDFWIIGEGSLRKNLETLTERLDLQDSIKFLGYINSPYNYLKNADLFLLTSAAEGYPLVICEALCCGVPVISTHCTGSNEILQNGKFGLLTNHDDDDIYLNVRNLIDNSNLRNHFQKMALERAELFNLENTMSNIYTLI